MNEVASVVRMLRLMPTAILRVDYPIHKGKPNPIHGKYHLVGSVPAECHKVYYETEDAAILAAQAAGATHIQRVDCSFV